MDLVSNPDQTKIVVVPETEEWSGIFIAHGDPQPLQLFDPSRLDQKQSASVFLRYSKDKGIFTHLHTGGKAYTINGSFTLLIGDRSFPRVTLNQSFSNPYLSIANDGTTLGSYALLSFLGVSQIINNLGREALIYETDLVNPQW